MDLAALLQTYGYPLLFLGVFAEGESLLLLAAYLAQRGYLDPYAVAATAFVAAVCGDQFLFHLGRRRGIVLLNRFPRLRDKVGGALARVERHQTKFVLSMRFLWGLRTALPIALGLTTMSALRYLWLDLISAAVWSVTVSFVGFTAGRVVMRAVEDLHRYEKWIALALLGLGAFALAIRWRLKTRA
ncbi:MAG: DedA family protein [Steroidobacteraceae bacterium]|nr:DedA family protein [Steroidobacteraceae bacterium]